MSLNETPEGVQGTAPQGRLREPIPLKRFLAFDYETFYPVGGFNDFAGSYETLAEAQVHTQVIDTQTGEVFGHFDP